jgi:2-polyprenyl-6-methoxyphenol hydroxylase-like FAD-dependent oxidoreductase
MAVIDSRRLGSAFSVDTDVCIVGAGAAGLTLAGEMQRSSARDICVVEAGGFQPDEDTQALHDLDSVGYPLRENHMARARYYGARATCGRAVRCGSRVATSRAAHGSKTPVGR